MVRLAGAYGPILTGSTVNGTLECSGNSAAVKDFGATNKITGGYSGCALAPITPEAPVTGTVPAATSLAVARPESTAASRSSAARRVISSTAAGKNSLSISEVTPEMTASSDG